MLDFPGSTSISPDAAEEFNKLALTAGIVIFASEFRGSPDSQTVKEYKTVCKMSEGCPVLVCLTQVSAQPQRNSQEGGGGDCRASQAQRNWLSGVTGCT